jgi:hypothetical protein
MIPDDVSEKAQDMADKYHISLDELTSRALIEKLSSMKGDPQLEARAKRADWNKFRAALAMVPHVEPEEHDRLD